jgi:hypothetical protein
MFRRCYQTDIPLSCLSYPVTLFLRNLMRIPEAARSILYPEIVYPDQLLTVLWANSGTAHGHDRRLSHPLRFIVP